MLKRLTVYSTKISNMVTKAFYNCNYSWQKIKQMHLDLKITYILKYEMVISD